MRHCQKRQISSNRRQLAEEMKAVVIVTVVQVLLTSSLNVLSATALSWVK
ncbi:hypothetical protein ABZ446_14825 [Streptomyces sp. NPDC005813]